MRIIQNPSNGNIAAANGNGIASHRNTDNRSWLYLNSRNEVQNTEAEKHESRNSICKNVDNFRNIIETTNITHQNPKERRHISDVAVETGVCNRQYRINNQNSRVIDSCTSLGTEKLDDNQETALIHCEHSEVDSYVYADSTPIDEDRTLEQSDSDDMSDNFVQPVPRGIVNPNYPGFQHLAHTLQDYSSNIETFYQSEYEMTDDDLEADISENTYKFKINKNNLNIKNSNITNNNNNEKQSRISDLQTKTNMLNGKSLKDIPDLLKTLSNNNNINLETTSFGCSDTDIENNFHTKDIIGDFNKEIEDEIKQLLNYNINIQDDLEELRKDIKDTFAKPIENTINNISDVVNHVIKKLVETQNDSEYSTNSSTSALYDKEDAEELNDINKDNETNIRTEMNLSRPTFLLIDNHPRSKIKDAILSDGKDEINIYENGYDTEALSHNVENTIKQLSTELRKIIPKLNEMRERDRLWTENLKETVEIDKNLNEIKSSSTLTLDTNAITSNNIDVITQTQNKIDFSSTSKFRKSDSILKCAEKTSSDRYSGSIKSPSTSAQNSTSVHKNDCTKEYDLESFDVYNIETALPVIDFDAIENHIKAAKEAERRKRNDREEIRKRLAMDADNDEYYSLGHIDRPGKKPSLHSRLQNGKNLQICFMNETASDNESQSSDFEKNLNLNSKSLSRTSIFDKGSCNHPYQTRPLSVNITKNEKNNSSQFGFKFRPSSFPLKNSKSRSTQSLNNTDFKETDFYTLQATLQTEARIALAQAKERAHIQMERERQGRAVSPVTEMLRRSMEKANAPLAADRRRVSRQLLTDMNIAQLQVIVNELHSEIESLNDSLVRLLMARDELHMGQDSMLVDIEDLTRYLGVKEQTKKTKGAIAKSGVRRLTSLVHK